MKPSEILETNRETIRRLVVRNRVTNPRVFGSVAKGKDTLSSDLDIVVDTLPDTTYFELTGLHIDLEETLGIKVDILTTGSLSDHMKNEIEETAIPI